MLAPNDLAAFDVVSVDAEIVFTATTNNTRETKTTTWAAAIQILWLTPLPRVIVAEAGGETFKVVGGDGVGIKKRTNTEDALTRRNQRDDTRPSHPSFS